MWNITPGRPVESPAKRSSVHGYTLLELLLVIGIAGLLAALAIPSFSDAMRAMELRTLAGGFADALQLARSEAIKRNARVVVCKTASGTQCSTDGGWEQGWIVFQDRNNDGLLQPGEPQILVRRLAAGNVRMSGNGNVGNYVSYTGSGSTHLVSHAFQAGTVTACSPGHPEQAQRTVIISSTGRVRSATVLAGGCP